jgi:spore maturation protein CgeB
VSGSRINLGLLSERRDGASSDDLITSRTFHIPACGGFLLHQRTPDVLECFTEGEEIACFDTPEELVAKVQYYLKADAERRRIAEAGRRRCVAEHSLAHRADVIIRTYLTATGHDDRKGSKLAARTRGHSEVSS